MFSSLNLFHSQRYYRNLWPRGFLEARQEWSHKHLPQKCETFFIQTQNSMFSRPSETSNIGIDQLTNRLIEYCEFVIMSILLFLETLTFKLFLKPWTAFAGVMMFVCFLQKFEHLYQHKDIFLWREAYSRQASGEGSFPRNVCTLSIDSSTHKKHLGKPLSRPAGTTTLKSKVRADFLDAFIEWVCF